jgi:hypothetical protein
MIQWEGSTGSFAIVIFLPEKIDKIVDFASPMSYTEIIVGALKLLRDISLFPLPPQRRGFFLLTIRTVDGICRHLTTQENGCRETHVTGRRA